MKTLAIIPVRMASTRFPGKPLAEISGLPMVAHCYYRTMLAGEVDLTYVATCDHEIFEYINSINGNVVMTSHEHNRATDRTAEALEKVETETGERFDVIIMVQGDEPLISPKLIDLIPAEFQNSEVSIVNILSKISSDEVFRDPNNVKAVMDKKNNILYFSREPIPSAYRGDTDIPKYMQVGVIAFRRDALQAFNAMEETRLEQIESVDMNRVLENGGSIRAIPTETINIGVDTPEELKLVEELMADDDYVSTYASR